MKKFVMVSLAVAGILFAVGFVFAAIGGMVGGYRFSRLIRDEIDIDDELEDMIENVGETVYNSTNGRWGYLYHHDSHSADHQGVVTNMQEEIDARGIRKIEVESGAGTFVIREKETSDGKIDITASGIGECSYLLKGDTLYIEGFKGLKWHDDLADNRMEIWICAGSSLDELKINLGAGVMDISDFRMNELEINVGAGRFLMNHMEIGELSVEVGAGEMVVSDTVVRDADIQVAMGECTYDGSIMGELEADCAMGNMMFSLTGNENDHNYEIECSAGNVVVGSFSASAVACEKTINNHAASKYEINCGMGNITVEFEE